MSEREYIHYRILEKSKNEEFDCIILKVEDIDTGAIYLLRENLSITGEIGDILELPAKKI